MRRLRAPSTALLALAAACAPRRAPAPPFPFGAAGRSDAVAPGVVHQQFVVPARDGRGPLAVHVLRAEPAAPGCPRVRALKPAAAVEGRAPTSALVAAQIVLDSATVGGVNADFFSFTPPGIPAAAHVQGGRVIAGPTARPVFAVDSAGAPWIGVLAVRGGFATAGGDTLPVHAWNRPRRDGVAVFDDAWGARTDSTPGRVFVTLATAEVPGVGAPNADALDAARGPAERRHYRVVGVDTGAVAALGPHAPVVVVGPAADAGVRARWRAVPPGAVLVGAVAFAPFRPVEAVGGFPVLVRAGAVTADVDTAGSAGFRGPNPRTAVGITRGGALLLVTVDGRQPGHSAGATLRETAELMRALGAAEALNLDGGGSTTLVARGDGGAVAVANRPSDKAGERPVANALAVRACPRR